MFKDENNWREGRKAGQRGVNQTCDVIVSAFLTGLPTVSARQHTDAVLTCPHAQGHVTWSRAIRGTRVTLLTVSDGHVNSRSERFGSRDNNELLIRNVVESDTSMYLCNERKTAYLNVTTVY